jgi:type I restriction enzyme, S subunit
VRIWRREAFDTVIADVSAGNEKIPQSEFLSQGRYAIVDQGKELIAGYTNNESHLCRAELPVIVFGDHTRSVKYVDFPFCMGADGVKVLRPKTDTDVKYLYHYLRQLRITEAGYDRHFKYLKRSSILIPPLAEQRRIADILDKADALRAKRRTTFAQIDSLIQSIFLETFGDPAKNPKAWRRASLRELGDVVTGSTPPSAKVGMFGGAIPFVTPGDLESDEPVKRSVTEEGASESVTVRPGAALVCCIGATIGKIGKASVRTSFNQQINAVDWYDEIIADYGYTVLRFFRPTIIAWGTSTTLPILKKSTFERIEIPVPPLEEQLAFSAAARRVAQIGISARKSLAGTDELFRSLQVRTFRGDL